MCTIVDNWSEPRENTKSDMYTLMSHTPSLKKGVPSCVSAVCVLFPVVYLVRPPVCFEYQSQTLVSSSCFHSPIVYVVIVMYGKCRMP